MKNKYIIEITETLQRQITIFAESEGRALDTIQERYQNCDIVLDYSDFIKHEIHSISATNKTDSF